MKGRPASLLEGIQSNEITVDTCPRSISKVYNYYSYLHECVVLGTIAAIIVVVVVLIVLFAIAGFIIQLLAPVIVGVIILIIVVVGGAWLYAKYRSR